MTNENIRLYGKTISPLVEGLLVENSIGIGRGSTRILESSTGCTTLIDSPCNDRFKVSIPYAGSTIVWEILFNFSYDTLPPDFIFGPEDRGFLVDIDRIKGLVNWDYTDRKALWKVTNEVLVQYREHHRSLIDIIPSLRHEVTSLTEHGGFTNEDIEIHVARKGENKFGQINMLLKLPVDFTGIPIYLTENNPGEDMAVLHLHYSTPEGTKVTPQLFLSPNVEFVIGEAESHRIPSFPCHGRLLEYVLKVCDLLKNKVDTIVGGYDRRREYVAALLSHFGRSVLEYDTESFTRISFMFEWNEFFFILHIDVPLMFPSDKPVLTFQSVYHEYNGRPFSKVVDEYPYSPRWGGNEMAERMRVFMLSYVPNFQKMSITGGSI